MKACARSSIVDEGSKDGFRSRGQVASVCPLLIGEVKPVSVSRSRRGGRLEGCGTNGRDVFRSARPALVECQPVRASHDGLLRIVVAHHRWARVDVAAVLKADTGLEVVGEASHDRDVLSIVRSTRPDVVLLGTRIPDHDGLGCLSLLRECHPEAKVIVCSASPDLDHIENVFRLGASGCILSTIAPAELAAAIRMVVEAAEYHARGTIHEDAAVHLLGVEVRDLN
jgi:CheY-like chemotaxis protein